MTVISYGKERPVALGSDPESWSQNRRAVTVGMTRRHRRDARPRVERQQPAARRLRHDLRHGVAERPLRAAVPDQFPRRELEGVAHGERYAHGEDDARARVAQPLGKSTSKHVPLVSATRLRSPLTSNYPKFHLLQR